jgi:hypothetical protein
MGWVESARAYAQLGRITKKLIAEVVASARDGEPPPYELQVNWGCERYHSLPGAGGYFDQDAALIFRMQALANIHQAVSHYVNASGAEIHRLTESERRILRSLKDLELMFV